MNFHPEALVSGEIVCDDLLEEMMVVHAELGGMLVNDDPPSFPRGLELRLQGGGESYANFACPYGNFSELRITDAVRARLGDDPSYRDLLTLATLEPELFA
jgi:hypothetical protein